MSDGQKDQSKLGSFISLMRIMDRAFIHKLRAKRPNITEAEIAEELKRWYMTRPGAEHGDGDGIVGDLSRFK